MKYKIVSLNPEKHSHLINKLKDLFKKEKFTLEEDFDYLFVIGGDGTLIHYLKEYAFKNKKIIGIKGGNVSFLTNFDVQNTSLDNISFSRIELLEIEINEKIYYAFNDFFISGSSFLKTDIFVLNKFFHSFRGSGLLFSTKIGSTAQNKSFLGPILFPSTNTWLMNYIGSQFTNNISSIYSSLVFSDIEKLLLKIYDSNFFLYIDGKIIKEYSDNNLEINIKLIKTNSFFSFSNDTISYIDRFSRSFLINEKK